MRFVIITGMGRSGTTFLAHLLDQSAGQEARHEHFADRTFLHLSFYAPDHPYLRRSLEAERRALVAQRDAGKTFVDVNGWLRHGTAVVRDVLADVRLFHLARDGRKVVSSMYRHKTYTAFEKSLPLLPDEPEALDAWPGWSRFERLCWLWQRSVLCLARERVPAVQLERLVEDYEYLQARLLEPAGLEIARADWERLRHRPLNRSRLRLANLVRRRPAMLLWSDAHERRFREICGPALRALDYD